jgi:hypothetical protein
MPKSRQVAGTAADPTLPKTPVTISGKEYNLCFALGALAEAETAIRREGHPCNVLVALPELNLANVRNLFPAALRTFHPEISYEKAVKMVTIHNVFAIANGVASAWTESIPEPEADPEEPVAAE